MIAHRQSVGDDIAWITFDAILRESDKAYLFDLGDGVHVWLPKSQIEDLGDDVVGIPKWLAEEKELESDW